MTVEAKIGGGAGAGAEVELWLVDARVPQPALDLELLDAAERERAARFLHESDRVMYEVAHAALRTVLAARTGLPAAGLRFEREPCPCCGELHGRPRLAAGAVPTPLPAFSLSHGGGLVLIGVAPDTTPIGVDVEALPSAETARETAVSLHPAEQAEFALHPDGAAPAAFARIWTRKEAYLKALGTGLGRNLAADYLGDDPAALPPGWTVTTVQVGPSHAAAFALATPGATFTLRESFT
ncbi:4'-phosphopantetheinyl transferase family protein [Streptacidiphilus jiangxiensis]|uniref:4'-phosphopantetheinyl transferase n=1 Tax=Streptacidiphilus jiangxiensis TaxID=235985 RepID=A0A1H7S0G3_STRJI|nr:4'-phosphopantetheinyl transferase superfamily protein [Streptacidiphilus jiangxiensis]SEL65993.1 4'-phosphopantetheinyl transferase [Streptacidiphilus jiangxiensis]